MSPYKVLVSIELLRLAPSDRNERLRILRFLETLAENPGRSGDFQECDEVGRTVQIKIIGNLALTYWQDHAVKEIKVVRIEKADHR